MMHIPELTDPKIVTAREMNAVVEMEEIFTEYCPCCEEIRVVTANEFVFNLIVPREECYHVHENQNAMGYSEEEERVNYAYH